MLAASTNIIMVTLYIIDKNLVKTSRESILGAHEVLGMSPLVGIE